MRSIERVGFVIKPHAPEVDTVLRQLLGYFSERGVECCLETEAADMLGKPERVSREELPSMVDLVIVLGGDGTLLSIAHLAAENSVPVMGVNMGSLGFLTETPLDEVFVTLDAYLGGDEHIVSPRQVLETGTRGTIYYCLNDIVINKGALARMIQCAMWINDKEISIPRSDGLIISTPTGSTAYSLSAGGPIIQPYIPAIIIAPICPHTLSFRPMVVASDSRIRIQMQTKGEKAYLTLDGQRGYLMEMNETVEVRTSALKLQLISSPRRNYFDLLQEKLGWGKK
ncbi:MAG: NAD(+)/NADH kinase [Candidatus Aminicenantaceae bacterium]|jgi:NAD+ kinase